LERRLNLLIYLNPDWKEEYGGSFEVWSNDMKTKIAGFAPVMNRMCCFSTGDDTMHGNPEPMMQRAVRRHCVLCANLYRRSSIASRSICWTNCAGCESNCLAALIAPFPKTEVSAHLPRIR
jgi:hypothetical protein